MHGTFSEFDYAQCHDYRPGTIRAYVAIVPLSPMGRVDRVMRIAIESPFP
jgi:hypothetical protein